MLKGNNKGFAITTVIYGLSIMGILLVSILMATMSTTRTNTRAYTTRIEEELNQISRTATVFTPLVNNDSYNYPLPQQYVVPEGQSGFYRIELWGAQGNGTSGGKGAYTSGIIYLKEGDTLYFYVGKSIAGKGGRATEVRAGYFGYGEYNSVLSGGARIMVAAGGGTNAGAVGGTLLGYNSSMTPSGGTVNMGDYSVSGTLAGYPSGYNSSGALTQNSITSVTYSTNTGAGGDGYYSSNNGTVGGVSYISGYAGVQTIKNDRGSKEAGVHISHFEERVRKVDPDTNAVSWEDGAAANRYKYVFYDGRMYPGVNVGNGKATIERVSDTNDRNTLKRNAVLKAGNYSTVKTCATGITSADRVRFSVISGGKDVANEAGVTKSFASECVTLTLKQAYPIDEIAVFHTDFEGKDLVNHKLYVGSKLLINSTGKSETEPVTGIRVSAYQANAYDNSATQKLTVLPNGDYYIIPVLADGKALTAAAKSDLSSNPLTLEYINGNDHQKWKVEVITDKVISPGYNASNSATYEYRITELARYKAMAIGMATSGDNVSYTDENENRNYIRAYTSFNSYARNDTQIWKITPVGDGTYIITTVVPSGPGNTGNIIGTPNASGANEFNNKVFVAINNNVTQRWKFITVDYSSN